MTGTKKKSNFRKKWYSPPRYCCTIGYRLALACYHVMCKRILEYFHESTDAKSNSVFSDCCDVIWLLAQTT